MRFAEPQKHLAIALCSATVMLLQLGLTRILSVLLWYHWAFFAISLAMLGMGAPGVWLAVSKRRPTLEATLLLAGVLTPLGVVGLVRLSHRFGAFGVAAAMFALLPAMLALGTAVCLLLMDAQRERVARMYASDLFGAFVGALLVVPLLWLVPTPSLAAALGFLPLVACALVSRAKKMRLVALALATVLAATLVDARPYALSRTKMYEETGAHTPSFERWTPTARLTIFPSLPWGSGSAFLWGAADEGAKPSPEQYWLEQDGSAGTPITRYDGDDGKLAFLFDDVTSVGYELLHPQKVAIVGAGGGRDILAAKLGGAERVDAIELNRGIVEAMRGPFAEFSGGVYDLPGVHAIVGEGRHVLTGSAGDYDFIQISMIDSWAATAAGAFSLSENNLYTLEAYRLYFRRLAPSGVVSTSRWLAPQFGFEVPRLFFLVEAALAAEGVDEPKRHLAVVAGGRVATVLMSKEPLSTARVTELERIAKSRGFSLLHPRTEGKLPAERVARLLEGGPKPLEKNGLVLSPPSDDRPFFFQMTSVFSPPAARELEELGANIQSVRVLRQLMLAMAAVTALLFFAPFAASRSIERGPGFWRGSGYFVAIGLGFMLVEIAWLQRVVLFLGHPSTAATVALGSMLLGAGIGSMLSGRLGEERVAGIGLFIALAVALVNALLEPVMSLTLGAALPVRVLVAAAVLLPASVPMGCAFPLGMTRFGGANRAWFWALNGAASVLASVGSLACAMEFGFLRVGYLGAATYVVAWALWRARPWRWVMRAVSAAVAVPLVVVGVELIARVVRTMAARRAYPMDLEWMEGGQLVHAQRLLEGRSLYDACADGFIAFAYPPVHAVVLAATGSVFGLDYAVGRTVSIIAIVCAAAVLCREAMLSCKSRPLGWALALAVLGGVAASYPVAGHWYDLVRVDSLYLALLFGGAALTLPRLAARGRRALSPWRIVAAALALTLAVFTKQAAVLFLPWILGFALWRRPKDGLLLVLATGLSSGLLLFGLERASGGRFWALVVEVMGGHAVEPRRCMQGALTIASFAPYLPFAVAVLGVAWRRRVLDARLVFWAGMTASALVVSIGTAGKLGAFVNNLASAVLLAPLFVAMALARIVESTPERRVSRYVVLGLSALGLCAALEAQRSAPKVNVVPRPSDRRAARELTAIVSRLEGGVILPAASFVPTLAGRKGTHFHEQGYVDVMGSTAPGVDVVECIANLDARWLVMSEPQEPNLAALLSTMYEPRAPLPANARPPVIGGFRVAAELYERRQDSRRPVARRDVRDPLELDARGIASWHATGPAFVGAATREQSPYQHLIVGGRGAVVNSYHPALLDEARGSVTSPPFTIDRTRLGMRVGGGSHAELKVELLVDGRVARAVVGAGRNVEVLLPVTLDVSDLLGATATLVITDGAVGEYGHILVSAIELYDEAAPIE